MRVVLFARKRLCGLQFKFVGTRSESGPVRANHDSDCHVSLCLLLQEKVAVVTKLKEQCEDDAAAGSVTVAEIAEGAACCEPPHPVTAALFCEAMYYLACGGRAASRKIASAGGIHAIAQQLLACLPVNTPLAGYDSAGCDKIASAGASGIPVIVQLLACLPDEEQVVKNAFNALIALSSSPLSDELAKAALPTIIAIVRAHPTRIGYEFLAKHVHHRTAFYECEGGTEVYDIAVSRAAWL